MTRENRRANWAKLVQEQNGSGLNAAACCRQKELNEKAFRLLDCAGLPATHFWLIPVHFVAGTSTRPLFPQPPYGGRRVINSPGKAIATIMR